MEKGQDPILIRADTEEDREAARKLLALYQAREPEAEQPQTAYSPSSYAGASLMQISVLAGEGDPYAMLACARRFADSLSARDWDASLGWLRLAAERLKDRSGDQKLRKEAADTCVFLGSRFEELGEQKRAFGCYQAALALDVTRDEAVIRCYEEGLGTEPDPDKVRELREKRALRGGIRERFVRAEEYLANSDGDRAVSWLRLSLEAGDAGDSANVALRRFIRALLGRVGQADEQGLVPDEQEEIEELELLINNGSAEAAFLLSRMAGSDERRRELLILGSRGWPMEMAQRCRQALEKPKEDKPPEPVKEKKPLLRIEKLPEDPEERKAALAIRRDVQSMRLRAWRDYRRQERPLVQTFLCLVLLVLALLLGLGIGDAKVTEYAKTGHYQGFCQPQEGKLQYVYLTAEKPDEQGDMRATLEIRPFDGELGESQSYSGYLCVQGGIPGFSLMTADGLRQIYTMDAQLDNTLELSASGAAMARYPELTLYRDGSDEQRRWSGGFGSQSGNYLTRQLPEEVDGLDPISPGSPNLVQLWNGRTYSGGLVLEPGRDSGTAVYELNSRYSVMSLCFGALSEEGWGTVIITADGETLFESRLNPGGLAQLQSLGIAGAGEISITLSGSELALADLTVR